MKTYPTKAQLLAVVPASLEYIPGAHRADYMRAAIAEGIARAHITPTFTRGFDRFACVGDTIQTDYDGFRIEARIMHDNQTSIEDNDLYPLEFNAKMFATREAHAEALVIREAWLNNEWHYCGVVLSITREGVMLDEDAASLWGNECNYPGSNNGFLTVVANELLGEAIERGRAQLKRLEQSNKRADAIEAALAVESMIDSHGLGELLEMIATICAEKAEHIRASYNDAALARDWDKAAKRVQACAMSAAVQDLIQ